MCALTGSPIRNLETAVALDDIIGLDRHAASFERGELVAGRCANPDLASSRPKKLTPLRLLEKAAPNARSP